MTTREIRTERIVQRSVGQRSVSPHNIGQLDNNLDNLLEDLQNSVSRPGSSLGVNGSGIHGGNYREYSTHKTVATSGITNLGGKTSDTRMEYRTAANPVTVPSESTTVVERTKDGTKEKTVYKTIKYQYDVTDSILPETSSRMQSNINQLDTLLDDLQQARKGTNINAGIDPGLLEPLDTTGGTTRQVTKKTVQRELVYEDSEQPPGGRITQKQQSSPTAIRQSDTEGSVTREVVYAFDDGTYGDIRQTRHQSPQRTTPQSNVAQTKSNTIQRTTNVQNYNYNTPIEPTTVETKEVEALDPNILSDLDPSLLPNPNTKVTTTIKTYTYEIPGTPYVSNTGYPSRVQSPQDVDRYVYNVSPGSSTINRNEVYKNESYHTRNILASDTPDNQHSYPSQRSPPYSQTTTYKEDNRNYYRGSSPQPQPPSTTYQTKIYKEDVRTTNKYGEFVPAAQPKQTYPPTNTYPPTDKVVSPPGGTNTTIIHKTETYNTTYGGEYPPNQTYDPNSPNQYPPQQSNISPLPPTRDTNTTYKYTSHNTTSNKYRDYPPGSPGDDRKPLLQPGKFPTEPSDHVGDGPPKRLDELMASFDRPENNINTTIYNKTTTTTSSKYRDDDASKQQLLPADSAAVTDSQKKKDIKDLPKTKNVAGPPVYYPPGHEMFAKKEESSAAYSAQGGYMKASGKYEYEAESKSKSKSSSGAAVVPVCLPLCCAMPCVIL